MAVVAQSAVPEEQPSDRLRAALDLFDFCERAFRHGFGENARAYPRKMSTR